MHCNCRNVCRSAAVRNAELMQRFKVLYVLNKHHCQISIRVHCFPLNSLFMHCRSSPSALSAVNWKVYGGVVSLDKLSEPYLIDKILLNENYNSKSNDQDVALLRLKSPVLFDGQSQLLLIKTMFMIILVSYLNIVS